MYDKPGTIFRPQPGQFRPYRFPPLVEERSRDDEFDFDDFSDNSHGHSNNSAAQYQEEFNNGFQDGSQKGYDEGLLQGQQQGLSDGHQQGYQVGYQEGKDQGLQEGNQQLTNSVMATDALLQQVQQVFHQHVREQSGMICELVQKVARQVIRCELTLQPQQLIALIEETLTQVPEQEGQITVHLNPQDCQRLQQLLPDVVNKWQLETDNALESGSCRVVTRDSEAIADSEERLQACMDAVRDTLLTEPTAEHIA
ncbi:MAG: flagellar assembly protein FliH [Plesiomonas sp.]|uniref:flagellar assembly protein FliH n=1 Tax=Plesiomonas sp. TaxID=2486279 RepID=UPI003F35B1DA